MIAHIFIHSCGDIVEVFDVEFEDLSEISKLLNYARKKYGDKECFCFDVMIV